VKVLDWLTGTRARTGGVAYLAAAVRVVTGVLFVSISSGKFVDHVHEVSDFKSYGIPIADIAVYVIGVVELLCGLLLVAGLFTRLAALLLACNMVGAIVTAGVQEGGTFNLGVAPAMLVAMVFLLWAGCGALAVDNRLHAQGDETRPALPD
jgi:putative oxidoreductase